MLDLGCTQPSMIVPIRRAMRPMCPTQGCNLKGHVLVKPGMLSLTVQAIIGMPPCPPLQLRQAKLMSDPILRRAPRDLSPKPLLAALHCCMTEHKHLSSPCKVQREQLAAGGQHVV